MWGRTSKRVAELSAALKQERALREAIERRLTTLERDSSAAWEVLASLVERDEQNRFFLGMRVMLKHEDALIKAAERLRSKGGQGRAS